MGLLTVDDELFTEVLTRHSDMIYRIAYQYLKSKSDAEDVVQDVFIKLLEKQPDFESDENRKAWLIRVTINLSKDRLRSFWRRKTIPLTEINDRAVEDKTAVFEELFQLQPKYRVVLYLHYYEYYTINEMADLLHTNPNTISARLQRGRQKLKLIIEEGEVINEKT